MNQPLPQQIGKYPVVRRLGSGATSEVYLCHDPFATRDVAVKLQHPHICQIYDAVADESLHYIVMEHVDGGTLERFCAPDQLLPIDKAVEIVFKCTRALEFAHKMGITHRDIKPANILYAGETDVKITDFGADRAARAGLRRLPPPFRPRLHGNAGGAAHHGEHPPLRRVDGGGALSSLPAGLPGV